MGDLACNRSSICVIGKTIGKPYLTGLNGFITRLIVDVVLLSSSVASLELITIASIVTIV